METPTDPPSTPTIPVSKRSPFIPAVAATILLIFAIVISWLVYQNILLKNQIAYLTPTSPQLSPPPPPPPINPMADWKTYKNDQVGFSLKYPPDQLVSCNYPNTKGLRLWRAPFDCPDGHDIFYEISVIENLPSEYKEYKKPSSMRLITINGIRATEKVYVYEDSDGPLQSLGQSTEVLVPKNAYIIQIQLLGNSMDQKNLFDQILSTLRFTN